MGKQELLQIIDNQRKEIRNLQERCRDLEIENDQMVENFKISSSMLLERLKDLEQFKEQMEQLKQLQMKGLGPEDQQDYLNQLTPIDRPETANVLNKMSKFKFEIDLGFCRGPRIKNRRPTEFRHTKNV